MNKLAMLTLVTALAFPALAGIVELQVTGEFSSASGGALYQHGDTFMATIELDVDDDGTWGTSGDEARAYDTTILSLTMDIYRNDAFFATHDLSEFETRNPYTRSWRQASHHQMGEEFSIFGDLFGGTTYIHTNIYAHNPFPDHDAYNAFDWAGYRWGDIFELNGIIPNCSWTIRLAEGGTYTFNIGPIDVVATETRSLSQIKTLFR